MKLEKKGGIVERILSIGLLLLLQACISDPNPTDERSDTFSTIPKSVGIAPGIIDEASGLAMSANLDGYLWTHQDSGQPNSVYLISKDGSSIKEYGIPTSQNFDWEDIAVSKGPNDGVSYLYVADIGNNNVPIRSTNTIYRIPEISYPQEQYTSANLETITFSYPDGPVDAEAMIVDPATKDIYIFSKEIVRSVIYRLPYPQSTTSTIIAEKVGVNPSLFIVTGADISADGTEVLVRNYATVNYLKRLKNESLGQTLTRASLKTLRVATEPQGEAICFDRENKGFYTLSERSNTEQVFLNYYSRN